MVTWRGRGVLISVCDSCGSLRHFRRFPRYSSEGNFRDYRDSVPAGGEHAVLGAKRAGGASKGVQRSGDMHLHDSALVVNARLRILTSSIRRIQGGAADVSRT